MVACHGELRALFLDDEVDELALLRELIAQTHAVVVDAEADVHQALGGGLAQLHEQLAVVVADVAVLTPHGLPRLVELGSGRVHHLKSVGEVVGIGQLEAQRGGLDNGTSFIVDAVDRFAAVDIGVHGDDAAGGDYFGCRCFGRSVA